MTDTSSPDPDSGRADSHSVASHPDGSGVRKWRSPDNLTSAVYGSVLASSVIIGAGSSRGGIELAAVLLVTGFIFWVTHVYAETVASVHGGWEVGAIRTGLRHEWPLMTASILPAIAAVVAGVLPDVTPGNGAWVALIVAILELQVWGYTAVRQSGMKGAPRNRALLLNLLIGVVMVGLKLVVPH